MSEIAIIDYGLGNLYSIYKAFAYQEIPARLTDQPKSLKEASAIVLPGVGAFEDGMKGLNDRGFTEEVIRFAATGKPVLGICLGMQMLMDESLEMGQHKGLGLIPGRVIPFENNKEKPIKIPHMGWNEVKGFTTSPEMYYFVHSYYVQPKNQDHVVGVTEYGSYQFCSIVQKDNILGFQFHPEKSANAGLALLKDFSKKTQEGL
ncbi:MAG: imidazole glycerol phosphate synthase subunit HisH [Deltaproteobacteria bacterium]|nr:MAG: imidazole glycerol phosphate synthase subunit HisH [Deltaproteobacteria bacterium]